jgi:hypothetical protein
MSRSASLQSWVLFVVFLLATPPAATALRPRLDEDTWWHLAVGRYIETHDFTFPHTDPLSRPGVEQHLPWVAYSWLYELALYEAYERFDVAGVLYVRYLLVLLMYLTLARFATRALGYAACDLTALGLMTISLLPLLSERPWHLTIIGTILTLDAAIRLRQGERARRFWWLPLYYVLWANTHIQFVIGLGILGLAWVATMGEGRRNQRWTPARAILVYLGLCGLATLANPYGFRLYEVIWEYATQSTPLRNVTELMPPDFRMWWNWPLALLGLWAAVLVARRGFPVWETSLLAAGVFFSLRMQRDLWFGCLSAVAVLSRSRGPDAVQSEDVPPVAVPFCKLLLAVVAAFTLVRTGWQLKAPPSVVEAAHKDYPAGALRFLREHSYTGPLFNDFNWGGYWIWNLPRLPVSIDGRTNLYGEERLGRAIRTWAGLPGWESDPDLLGAAVIVGPRTQRLTELLLERPDEWVAVYEDEVSVVFIRPERGPAPRMQAP